MILYTARSTLTLYIIDNTNIEKINNITIEDLTYPKFYTL